VAFGFIFYGFPSGFMLYIMTSSGLSIIESRIIKLELAREEAAGGGAGGAAPNGGGPAPPLSYPAKSQRSEKPARPQKRKKRR